jgi:MFS family permease
MAPPAPRSLRVPILTAILAGLVGTALAYSVSTGQIPSWVWLMIFFIALPLGIALLAWARGPSYSRGLKRFE